MRPSINRRWHRADLYVSPFAALVLVAVVSVVFIIAAVSS
jgi:hypothetical protein